MNSRALSIGLAAAALQAACSSATRTSAALTSEAQPAAASQAESPTFLFHLTATADSAVKLARFAFGSIDGKVQIPQIRSDRITISTHYVRPRRGGGQTEVAVIALVSRKPVDSVTTLMELSAWALDQAAQQTYAQRLARVPNTPVSSNAPAIRTPRAVVPRDTVDWNTLQFVAEALERAGAKRVP